MGSLDDLRKKYLDATADAEKRSVSPIWDWDTVKKLANSRRWEPKLAQRHPRPGNPKGDLYEVVDLRIKFGGATFEDQNVCDLARTNPGALRWLYCQPGIPEACREVMRWALGESDAVIIARNPEG